MNTRPRIVLASSSPRRQGLLREIGLDFDLVSPEVDERRIRGESARNMVLRLSEMKARAGAEFTAGGPGDRLVIAADTTVVSAAGRILEKPLNADHAVRMVRALAGRKHSVYTGYCVALVRSGTIRRWIKRAVRTDVKMRPLSASQVKDYVALGESLDKAGGYAVQGAGMALIERVSGSYTNVVGLPMSQLTEDLETLGGIRLFGEP